MKDEADAKQSSMPDQSCRGQTDACVRLQMLQMLLIIRRAVHRDLLCCK